MEAAPDRTADRFPSLALEADLRGDSLALAVYAGADTVQPEAARPYDATAVARLTADLAGVLARATQRDPRSAEARRQLARVGQRLFDQLIPDPLRDLLSAPDAGLLTLRLTDQTVALPWELLFDGDRFLCERYGTGRLVKARVRGAGRTREPARPCRALVIGDPRGDLPSAADETRRMQAALSADADRCRADLKCARATVEFVLSRLREYDLVHYAGHATYSAEAPDTSAWVLADGALEARQVRALSGALPVLVFANACGTGQTVNWLTDEARGVFGLASAFLMAGVRHYVGTLAPVLDEGAAALASAFYEHLLGGLPVGRALRRARDACATDDGRCNLTGLSYVLYGDPSVVLFPADRAAAETRETAGPSACSVCGSPILSRLGVAGDCETCGAPICRRCWTARGARVCRAHAVRQSAEPESAALACGNCGRAIADAGLAGGRCLEPACEALICAQCWARGGDSRLCADHTETPEDRLAALQEDLAVGRIDRLVTTAEAQQRETVFLGRLRLLTEAPIRVTDPATGAWISVTARPLPGTDTNEGEDTDLPTARTLRFRLDGSEPLWRSGRGPVRLHVRTISDAAAREHAGAQHQPARLADLHDAVAEATAEADRDGCRVLVLIAATAGWAPDAAAAVTGDAGTQSLAHPSVAVVLADLHDGVMLFRSSDPRTSVVTRLGDTETDEERVLRVMAYVRDRLLDRPAVGLVHVARACNVDEDLAREAFRRLVAAERYRTDTVAGAGEVIMRPSDDVSL